jgi:hypothetical protein
VGTLNVVRKRENSHENAQKLSKLSRKTPLFGVKLSEKPKTLHKTLKNSTAMEDYFCRRFFVRNFASSKDKK